MHIIIFETPLVEDLYPITLTRHAGDILCAGININVLTLVTWPEAIVTFCGRTYLGLPDVKIDSVDFVLAINASIVPSVKTYDDLKKLVDQKQSFIMRNGEYVIAVYGPAADIATLFSSYDHQTIIRLLQKVSYPSHQGSWPVLKKLHEVIVYNADVLGENMKHFVDYFPTREGDVYFGKNVTVDESCVFDTSTGPIMIGNNATIEPFCHISGPVMIGDHTIIRTGARLKHGVTIGSTCKVGGEVESSVIDGFSNKQHHGSLAHSYVGSWVNIGGGSSNADLKNTYGEVIMAGQTTGKQFIGCVIGDYAKASINTAIMTGKVIGVGSVLYGTILHDVPSFTNAGTWLANSYEVPIEMALAMQLAMFTRRELTPTPQQITTLMNAFKLTALQRKRARVRHGKPVFKE